MIPGANESLFHLDMAMWLIFYAVEVQLDRHKKQLTIPPDLLWIIPLHCEVYQNVEFSACPEL